MTNHDTKNTDNTIHSNAHFGEMKIMIHYKEQMICFQSHCYWPLRVLLFWPIVLE